MGVSLRVWFYQDLSPRQTGEMSAAVVDFLQHPTTSLYLTRADLNQALTPIKEQLEVIGEHLGKKP